MRDITEGRRDPAERMMKRRATEEKTERWWRHSRESKIRPVVKIKKKKKRSPESWTRFSLKPAVMFPPHGRIVGCKTKEKSVYVLSVTQFPLGKTAVAERETEKNGRRRERGRACCQLKILVILTHIHTHILDSLLALACRYDATVIHDS